VLKPSKLSSPVFATLFTFAVAASLLVQPTLARAEGGQDLEDTVAPLEDAEEQPPKPEPPYPGSEKNRYAADPSMAKPAAPAERLIPRPTKIDEDGNYYYDTTPSKKPQAQAHRPGMPAPKHTEEDGTFIYDTKTPKHVFSGRPGEEKPVEMLASGEYRYKVPATKATRSASFRFGVVTAPAIRNHDNGLTFKDIYGSAPFPVLLVDYEFYRMFQNAGRLGLKFGSGLMAANGPGHFRKIDRIAEKPDESFLFVNFPNTLTANYRFQFAEKQVVVPFIEGGAGYYTFAEVRDDGARPKLGGALVGLGGGGLYFLMDWLDPQAIRQLDSEYGISHLWLTTEVRATIGLNTDLDFTNQSVNAGFMMEF
jgi:hypothetical protein